MQGNKKKPPKFLFFKFHLDNLILAAVELKKTKQTKTRSKRIKH